MHTNDRAARRDDHNVVIVRHQFQVDKLARLFVENARLDTLAAAALETVILDGRPLAVTV